MKKAGGQYYRNARRHADRHNSDSLGREVISISHNRRVSGLNPRRRRTKKTCCHKIDASGKPLWVCDAKKNIVIQYIIPSMPDTAMLAMGITSTRPATVITPCYDMSGNPCSSTA